MGTDVSRDKSEGGIVYSTAGGKICPGCNMAAAHCICQRRKSTPEGDGGVRIMRETQGRQGKGVTMITGLPLDVVELKKLAKALKKKCGCGGSVKNGVIEIQGDHRDVLEEELSRLAYTVKRSGG